MRVHDKYRFPAGMEVRVLFTGAACGATDWQLVLAAAYNEQTTLHSRRETQQTIQQLNKQQLTNVESKDFNNE